METSRYATIDLTPAQLDDYYNGYCNGTLWPLFHYYPELFRHEQRHYDAYQSVNALFARQLLKLRRSPAMPSGCTTIT